MHTKDAAAERDVRAAVLLSHRPRLLILFTGESSEIQCNFCVPKPNAHGSETRVLSMKNMRFRVFFIRVGCHYDLFLLHVPGT